MKSQVHTPEDYLAQLPEARRLVLDKLRATLREQLPAGFVETIEYGMIAYVVPHALYPAGYHTDPRRPLPFISLASQAQHVALYHMGLGEGPLLDWFSAEWPKHTTMKLDLGKSCLRFKKLDAIPYALLGQLAARVTPQEWIATYTANLAARPR